MAYVNLIAALLLAGGAGAAMQTECWAVAIPLAIAASFAGDCVVIATRINMIRKETARLDDILSH